MLSAADIYTKGAEFDLWLYEQHGLSRSELDRKREKEMFARFAEDFNTATLPHDKYYALEEYEAKQHALDKPVDVNPTRSKLTDEELIREQRRMESVSNRALADDMRLAAMKETLAIAKQSNGGQWQSIIAKHETSIAKPTFESIAKQRELEELEKAEKLKRKWK